MTQPSAAAAATGAALTDEIRGFLAAPRFATIATLDPDGSPHQAVVWYALDGDALLVNSRVERHWPRNLDRDGRVAVAVYDSAEPYHFVGLKGRAERLHEGPAATSDIQALARRYGRDPERYGGQARVTYRIAVEAVFDYRS
ncbi:MAG TPA: TIGR03618 family F420-dependent PPOX class oxidoreductase [Candidatus Limnocylindrales bacterium]|nr:TIGR03618 family F420-dependent PPOX class oxidoreductase [Candidatus Limnocylindrales bacterium]